MSAPQPPADGTPQHDPGPAVPSDATASTGEGNATYDFHGEQLDFDPYRFGAPEPVAPSWSDAPGPSSPPGPAPSPGDRWSPDGAGADRPDVRPGDYWQGGGSQPPAGSVFPPAGYAPPTPPGVDLGKTPTSAPGQPSASTTPPGGYGAPGPSTGYHPTPGYPPPSYQGYPTPGSYPGRNGPSEADRWRAGNKIAVWGFVLGLIGCVLFFTSFVAVLIGGTGVGLSIAGLVKANRGAPHKGMAIAGIVLSILAIAGGIALLVYAFSQYDISCLANLNGDTSRVSECVK